MVWREMELSIRVMLSFVNSLVPLPRGDLRPATNQLTTVVSEPQVFGQIISSTWSHGPAEY